MLKTLSTTLLAASLAFGFTQVLPAYRAAGGPAIVGSGTFVSASGEVVRADYRGDDTVLLRGSDGRRQRLRLAVSASGSRYVQGALEWWEHQGEATLSDHNRVVFSGQQRP